MQEVLDELRDRYELVIRHSAGHGHLGHDPAAHEGGWLLVVVRMKKSTRDQTLAVRRQLDRVDASLLGVVANYVSDIDHRYGYGEYGYSGHPVAGVNSIVARAARTRTSSASRRSRLQLTGRDASSHLPVRAGGLAVRGCCSSAACWWLGSSVSRIAGISLCLRLAVAARHPRRCRVASAATYEIARQPECAPALVRALLPVFAWQSLVLCLVDGAIVYALVRAEGSSVQFAGVATLVLVPAQLAQQYALAVLQGLRRYGPFNVLRLLPTLLYAVLLVALFATGGDGPRGHRAVDLANVTTSVGSVATALRGLAACGDAPAPRSRLVGVRPARLPWLASPLDAFRIDQFVVGIFLSPAALGLYVVGIAFTNLPRFVATSAGMVAYPHLASLRDGARARRALWRYTLMTTGACIAVTVVLAASMPLLIPAFFGEAFADSVSIAQIMLIGVVFLCLRRILSDCARAAAGPAWARWRRPLMGTALPAFALLVPRFRPRELRQR